MTFWRLSPFFVIAPLVWGCHVLFVYGSWNRLLGEGFGCATPYGVDVWGVSPTPPKFTWEIYQETDILGAPPPPPPPKAFSFLYRILWHEREVTWETYQEENTLITFIVITLPCTILSLCCHVF